MTVVASRIRGCRSCPRSRPCGASSSPCCVDRRITDAGSHWSAKFNAAPEAVGPAIEEVRRRGKYLLIGLDDGRELIIHLGMTGHLHPREPGTGTGRVQPGLVGARRRERPRLRRHPPLRADRGRARRRPPQPADAAPPRPGAVRRRVHRGRALAGPPGQLDAGEDPAPPPAGGRRRRQHLRRRGAVGRVRAPGLPAGHPRAGGALARRPADGPSSSGSTTAARPCATTGPSTARRAATRSASPATAGPASPASGAAPCCAAGCSTGAPPPGARSASGASAGTPRARRVGSPGWTTCSPSTARSPS